ncbi:MAG: hypothetical protein K0B10_15845 [Vicingaceae bacterium]|nr:hypothetical protein [Vicingaceae bacterium]
MQQLVLINDAFPSGKLLLQLLKEFKSRKKDGAISFLTEDVLEEKEDKVLLKLMNDAQKSGKAETKTVLKKLNLE